MKISATKPHFFKPILPGFENGLKIPIYFAKYILETTKDCPNEALLKKKGNEWRVEVVNDCFVGDGWARFAKENTLKPCDFVVFKHHGNMVFDVAVFDGITQCKKEQHTNGDPRPSDHGEEEAVEKEIRSEHGEEEEKVCPHFIGTIKPYSQGRNHCFRIPMKFAQQNGLDEKRKMVLEDKEGRKWQVNLCLSHSHLSIYAGWKKFEEGNGIKVGDTFKFEIVENGAVPVVRFILNNA